MKYMLFAWNDYGASGGMNDLVDWYGTIEDAESDFNQGRWRNLERGQIVNATSLQVEKEL